MLQYIGGGVAIAEEANAGKAKKPKPEDSEAERQFLEGFEDANKEKGSSQAAIAWTEERYRLFVENFQGIAFQGDLDTHPLFFHGGIGKLTGYAPEDFNSGRIKWEQLVHPEDRGNLKNYTELLRMFPGQTIEREYRISTRDGQSKWVHETLQAGPGGVLEGAIYDVTEHRKAEDKLRASVREKEALLKEIHHRVKNNLQVIQSLLSLQSARIKDSVALEILRESQNRVRSMALIHERICMSNDLNRLDFYDYVRKLINGLFQSYGRKEGDIDVVLEIEDVHIGIDEAVPCGMILGELLSNSLKHAFPDGKGAGGAKAEIRVEVSSRDDGTVTMVVADNGVGMPSGIDLPRVESLGLQLVYTLVEQLGGTIKLNQGHGVEYRINFKSSALAKGG